MYICIRIYTYLGDVSIMFMQLTTVCLIEYFNCSMHCKREIFTLGIVAMCGSLNISYATLVKAVLVKWFFVS